MILPATKMRSTPCWRSCFPSSRKCLPIRADQRHSPCLNATEAAQVLAATGVETLAALLHELAPRNYGRKTAQLLVELAQHSTSSGVATAARSRSLKVLCDQLEHTQKNLAQLEEEIDQLLDQDSGATGVKSVPEFGRKMVAVLRAHLGDVMRFARAD